MKTNYKNKIDNSLDSLTSMFPNMTKKNAQKALIQIIKNKQQYGQDLAKLLNLVNTINICEKCNSFAEGHVCYRCQEGKGKKLIIFSTHMDLLNVTELLDENYLTFVFTKEIKYLINHFKEDKEVKQLFEMLNNKNLEELVISLSPTLENEILANLIKNNVLSNKITVTKIATGVPVGGSIEYVDSKTYVEALKHRK